MNDIIQSGRTQSTIVMGLTAAMAAVAAWPDVERPAYFAEHSSATYTSFERAFHLTTPSTGQDFGREIGAVYSALSDGQEPLGAEFEAVWDANAADLYEA